MEKLKKDELEEILMEERGKEFTGEQLRNMGFETDGIITKDDLEIYRQKFPELSPENLAQILSLTIKRDDISKIITFLGMLTAFTEEAQINITYNAPASTGKSYIPLEISQLFPRDTVETFAYSSPTAFFHEKGQYDSDRNLITIDLSRKILIFNDMPDFELLKRLRPLLSHDNKELNFKITDKTKRGQNRTKTVLVKGFPVIIFCSARTRMDEQETSRVILLSPEITEEKIADGISQKLNIYSNENIEQEIEENPERKLLIERINIIKKCCFNCVIITNTQTLSEYYQDKNTKTGLVPADMRNLNKIYSLITGLTLLNFPHRQIKGKNLIASERDIKEALFLWKQIERYQNYGIPPFNYWYYEQIFIPAYKKNNKNGLKRKDLLCFQAGILAKTVNDFKLRVEIIPALLNANLIREEKDPEDKREKLYYPVQED